ncbi:family 10 glycosylhydrolase [bacterium]|nr:family 10 glycosylhydrolase [bacterium]
MKLLKISLALVFLSGTACFNLSCNRNAPQDEAAMSIPLPLKGNGIYLTPNLKSAGDVDLFIEQCKTMRINKIFLMTKNSKGEVVYPSKNYRVSAMIDDFDCYGAICKAAHREGINVHAWFVIFHEGVEDPVPIIEQHPEYLLVNREGLSNVEQPTWITVDPKYTTYWVCPTAVGYRDYLKEMMQEVIDLYNVDGIHLDYIRYPEEVDARHYCYCDRCVALFKENYGYTLPANDVIKNRYWVTQMCNNVTNAVKDFADFAHQHDKLISAYVFTDYTTAIEAVYQNWPWFSRYLDFIIPTTYEVSPAYIHEIAAQTKAVLHEECMLFPTVYAAPIQRRSKDGGKRWYSGNQDDVVSTFKAWVAEDVDGVVLFHYDLMMNPDYVSEEQLEKNINSIREISQEQYR